MRKQKKKKKITVLFEQNIIIIATDKVRVGFMSKQQYGYYILYNVAHDIYDVVIIFTNISSILRGYNVNFLST